MSVVAKFYVSQLQHYAGMYGATTVHLHVVCRGEENKLWASATPTGTIQMAIRNEVAAEQFELGEEYEITFRKVPKE